MSEALTDPGPWLAILCSAAICYGWRAAGVALSRGLDPDGPLVRWLTCVSYAMLAAVVARVVVLPSGALAEVPNLGRYGACVAALAVFLVFGKNVIAGTATGFAAIVAFSLWFGTG